jgi:hypothetical protein
VSKANSSKPTRLAVARQWIAAAQRSSARPSKRRRQAVARAWIDYDRRSYETTRNPVYAWDAIAGSLSAGLPLPEWTRVYLFACAGEITPLSRDRVPKKGQIAKAVAIALGFRPGRVNPFEVHRHTEHELMLAFAVYETHAANWGDQQRGRASAHDWRTIFQDAARRHHATCDQCKRLPSWQTMERYWRKHALTVIPPHLIDAAQSHKVADILR